MLTKPSQNRRFAKAKLLIAIPLTAVCIFCCAINGVADSKERNANAVAEMKIRCTDKLAITIQTVPGTPAAGPQNNHLVDMQGGVTLSLIGRVIVAGLTTAEAQALITQRAKQYFKEPVVNVKYAD